MSISEKRIFRSYGMITMGTFLWLWEPVSFMSRCQWLPEDFQVWELYLKNYLESRCLL